MKVQIALASMPQAAAVGRISGFLTSHPDVILLEARVTASCLADGSADPIGRAAAEDLMVWVSSLEVDSDRISVREMPCTAGAQIPSRGRAIDAWACRTETSRDGIRSMLK